MQDSYYADAALAAVMDARIKARSGDPRPLDGYGDWIHAAKALSVSYDKLLCTLENTVLFVSGEATPYGYAALRQDALQMSAILLKIIESADEVLTASQKKAGS
jgi:hypothetical protein